MKFIFEATDNYKYLTLVAYPNDNALLELREFFKREADTFFFNPAYKSGNWDGIDSFFLGYRLAFGLWHELMKFFKDRPQYTLELKGVKEFLRDVNRDKYDEFLKTIFDGTDVKKLRYYQYESALQILKFRYSAADLSTAAGKTVIFFIIAMYLKAVGEIDVNHKMLIVVPKKSLSSQTFKRFTENYHNGTLNPKIVYFGGKSKYNQKKFDEAEIVISTYQSLARRERKVFKSIYHIGVDEAHGIKGDSLKNILNYCGELYTRFGLSGTLIENKTKSSFLTAQKYFGPFVYEYETHRLISDGYAPDVHIKRVILQYPKNDQLVAEYESFRNKDVEDKLKHATETYNLERQTIIKHPLRNEFINKLSLTLNKNKLFLFNNVKDKYGYELYENMLNLNEHTYYIDGSIDEDDREDFQDLIEVNENCNMVASFGTFSTGIDISNLHYIIFTESYQAYTLIRQSIGRGLRNYKDKKHLVIIDIIDDFGKYSKKHANKRMEIYKEQKFTVETIKKPLQVTISN